MITFLITTTNPELGPLVEVLLDSLPSMHSRRAYRQALQGFISWCDEHGRPALNRALVEAYKQAMIGAGLASSTVNVRLSAIRKLAEEAAGARLLDLETETAIVAHVHGAKSRGRRSGNWLPRSEAQALLEAPDCSTLKGLRDRAILAVLLGGGLRRSEVARLAFDDIRQLDGRWVIVDLVGKGGRVRTVPLPAWAKAAIGAWAEAAGIRDGRIFRPVARGELAPGDGLTPQTIWDVVALYAGADIAPHDLRRTYAKLAHRGGAPVEQIQFTLGHASIETTQRYLGLEQDLADAPCDRLGLRLDMRQADLPGME